MHSDQPLALGGARLQLKAEAVQKFTNKRPVHNANAVRPILREAAYGQLHIPASGAGLVFWCQACAELQPLVADRV
jgi:hypothetical protein